MKCPHCKDSTLVMSDRQGIEIDYCPTCRGVWLDRGELDKIIERSQQAAPAAAPQAQHQQRPSSSDSSGRLKAQYGHTHRKKSWLGELFD